MSRVSLFDLIISYLINKKPFRLSKNGQMMNIFKNVANEDNEMERNFKISKAKQDIKKNIQIEISAKHSINKQGKINNDMDEDEKQMAKNIII